MSLDQIKLNASLTATWYEDLLVDAGGRSEQPKQVPLLAPAPPMLGNYARKILILVQEPGHAFLHDEDLSFLTGVISACKMSLADVGIVNLTASPIDSFDVLMHGVKPSACWVFGIDGPSIGLPNMDDPNHSYRQQNIPIFWAPSLSQLATDPMSKRTLWGQLKKHYGI